MQFSSILFIHKDKISQNDFSLPFYDDLNLDQIIETVISYGKEYDIKRFFYTPLPNIKDIQYRQDVMKDLENPLLFSLILDFSQKMKQVETSKQMIEDLSYKEYKITYFLQMSITYIEAVEAFANALNQLDLHSNGFILLDEYIQLYLQKKSFISLKNETKELKKKFDSLNYEIVVDGLTIRVRRYENEVDYSQVINNIFEKFKVKSVENKKCQFEKNRGINHVNAKILEFVAKLYPSEFEELERLYTRYDGFINDTLQKFCIEVQFYMAYFEYIRVIEKSNLVFCYPKISTTKKSIKVEDGFDLALAFTKIFDLKTVVTNSYSLEGKERIIIITGANQGGKSTFARAIGQINYLASLGLKIPASKANLFLTQSIFTHFEKEEKIENLRSKLQDDLTRVEKIFSKADGNSLVILNEIFSSTSLQDAIFLSQKIMDKISKLDLFCIWVTFIVDLNKMSEKTVSMVSEIDIDNIENRTYEIIRKKADGLAYAKTIAKKYHLSYEQILDRIE
jgi:DNA mismatch repair ATPase MutS